MEKTAVVTGAGSGVGQAVVLALARKGWQVALVGRRRAQLQITIKLAGKFAGNLLACPCDISDSAAVEKMARAVLKKFKTVEVLVNGAGTNAPKRSLRELSLDDYHMMLDTNLDGAFFCVQAFLPGMRERKSGTIVNIVSDSAKLASAKAGPAYVMSKFGMTGLTQSINAEERAGGIRACAIFPGEIDTALLDLRPNPPTAEARARMLRSEDVADCAMLAIELPPRALVHEIFITPP